MSRIRPRLARTCVLAATIIWLAAMSAAGLCAVTKDVLDNGLVVITCPSDEGNLVAVQILVKASVADEPPGKAGLRQLVQQTLVRGSENRGGSELATALDDIGARFDTGLSLDYADVHLMCLSGDFDGALSLLAETLRRPAFPERELEGRRTVVLDYLKSLQTNPFDSALRLMREGLYRNHPYALPVQGTPESLAAITRDDLVSFHHRFYVPNSTIIAVAGGVSREAVVAAARRCFGDWLRVHLPVRQMNAPRPLERSVVQLAEAPVGQAYLMLGYAVGPPQPDSYAVLEVLRAVLGRGMGSRFFGALRDEAAAIYAADAYHYALTGGGYLAAYVGAEQTDLEHTRQLVVAEFERLRREPVSPAELNRAQQFAVGAHLLDHQHTLSRAFHLAWYEAIGLGCEFDERYAEAIKAVTAEQVQAAARSYFDCYSLGLILPRT